MPIAVACCRKEAGSPADEHYPDRDAAPLQSALAAAGVESVLLSWDDPEQDWSAYPVVLVSSTWDSVDRPIEYLEWTRRVGLRLHNRPAAAAPPASPPATSGPPPWSPTCTGPARR